MITDRKKNLEEYKQSILKSLKYLKQSYEEIQALSLDLQNANSEILKMRFIFVRDVRYSWLYR